ncbi:connector enhancer of kinase suppressor of ras 2-like [Sycon ciliatum]|uniref:connector enhancer of kinase suppressor of ras 2-like n=1 Tax=Sycon ciliatum TaxID=27933 RepID=UPI0031F61F42
MLVSKWTATQVVEWLRGLSFPISPALCSAVIEADINGASLLKLDHSKLIDLKVTSLGHRDVILSGIKRLSCALSDHHSERCIALANDVIMYSHRVQRYLSSTYSIPVPRDRPSQPDSATSASSPGLQTESSDTGKVRSSSDLDQESTCTRVSDLLYTSRRLALWLDRNPTQEYAADYSDFRDLLLRYALFIACKFSALDSDFEAVMEKCSVMGELASSVKRCLAATSLGYIRPVQVKATLSPAKGDCKEWGFSVKCCYGLALINCIVSDTPAAECDNLRARDEVASVDGVVVTGWAFENITQKLRDIDKSKPLELVVLRGNVQAPSAEESSSQQQASSLFKLVPESLSVGGPSAASGRGGDQPVANTPVTSAAPSSSALPTDGIVNGDGGDGVAQTSAQRTPLELERSDSKAQMCDDEGSSPEVSGDEQDDEDSGRERHKHTDVKTNRILNDSSHCVKPCSSDGAVARQPRHSKLQGRKSESSAVSSCSADGMKAVNGNGDGMRGTQSCHSTPIDSTEPKALEFGYRTQIVGGVVMRIPVTQNEEPSKQKAAKKNKWAVLSAKIRSKRVVESSLSMQGIGRADLEKKDSNPRSATSSSEYALDSPVTVKSRRSFSSSADPSAPKDACESESDVLGTCEGFKTDRAAQRDSLKKKRSSHAMIASGLSRMLDKETTVGDCDVPAPSLTDPECKGWMTKQGNVKKNWKRRWFILKNLCLYYYRTPTDQQALNVIPLPSYMIELAPDIKKSFALRLHHSNARTFLFYCDTFEEMIMWMDALRVACGGQLKTVEQSGSELSIKESLLTESSKL